MNFELPVAKKINKMIIKISYEEVIKEEKGTQTIESNWASQLINYPNENRRKTEKKIYNKASEQVNNQRSDKNDTCGILLNENNKSLDDKNYPFNVLNCEQPLLEMFDGIRFSNDLSKSDVSLPNSTGNTNDNIFLFD